MSDEKIGVGIDHGAPEGSKSVVSIVKDGVYYPVGELKSIDFADYCEYFKERLLKGLGIPKPIYEFPPDFNYAEAMTKRRVYEARIAKMRWSHQWAWLFDLYAKYPVYGMTGRNPDIGLLRRYFVNLHGWTNRKFKRTPISVIKKLWRNRK